MSNDTVYFFTCLSSSRQTFSKCLFNSLCLLSESKDGSKTKGRRGAKNSATAAKVALMKLKLHAAGDKGLPQVLILCKNNWVIVYLYTQFNVKYSVFFLFCLQTERTYFQVYLPKESKESSQPMFFCSKWSVGKVVDYAASLASLKNNNNIPTAKVTDTHWSTLLKMMWRTKGVADIQMLSMPTTRDSFKRTLFTGSLVNRCWRHVNVLYWLH